MRIVLTPTPEDARIAHLTVLAIGLSLAEATIPLPLPGVKPGLANIVTLVVLLRFGLGHAAWVSLLRVVAVGLITGSFLSPGFFLSLTGQLAALAMLAASRVLPDRWFGPVSHSILAGLAHVFGQVALVWLWFVPETGLSALLPWLAAASLIFGTINGLTASHLLALLEAQEK